MPVHVPYTSAGKRCTRAQRCTARSGTSGSFCRRPCYPRANTMPSDSWEVGRLLPSLVQECPAI